jgi:hypothetical protein
MIVTDLTMYEGKFQRGTDYKTSFVEEAEKLMAQELTPDFKNKLLTLLTEEYMVQTGEKPDSKTLNKLATWVLEDKSKNAHKMSTTEYPVLSWDQQKLRWRRELVSPDIETKTTSSQYKINGKRKPKQYKNFGEVE